MNLKLSTGMRNKLLDTGSLKAILEAGDGGCIRIYSGSPPATADAAVTGTLLCSITTNGVATGSAGSTLKFDSAAAGVMSKAADPWSGVNVATGQATYFRHVATGDTGAASTTEARMQGDIAAVGAALNLSNTNLVNGAPQTINGYSVAAPTL